MAPRTQLSTVRSGLVWFELVRFAVQMKIVLALIYVAHFYGCCCLGFMAALNTFYSMI